MRIALFIELGKYFKISFNVGFDYVLMLCRIECLHFSFSDDRWIRTIWISNLFPDLVFNFWVWKAGNAARSCNLCHVGWVVAKSAFKKVHLQLFSEWLWSKERFQNLMLLLFLQIVGFSTIDHDLRTFEPFFSGNHILIRSKEFEDLVYNRVLGNTFFLD